jgi:lipooligosaccharide transport system ATP-binding protein
MINAHNLIKTFFNFNAVNNLNLQIQQGECFGLLGPNGAGKSTFIGMTYGAVQRTSGDLKIFGFDPKTDSQHIKKKLGVVTQENALDESLTVYENMELYCAFVGIVSSLRKKRIEDLLEYMNLSHKRDVRIQTLSGGMKRRLVFVRALLNKPELLILDEPTTGLDPGIRHLLWSKVKELHQSGTTILLTTHYMHEAEVLCNRLVIMNKGEITGEGSPKELIDKNTPGYVGFFSLTDKNKIQDFIKSKIEFELFEDHSGLSVRTKSLENLNQMYQSQNLQPLQIRPANLEDVFLKLTGQEINQDA